MALWPNNRRDILGLQPVGISAFLAFQGVAQPVAKRIAYFANQQIAQSSSVPEGSFQGFANIIPPLVGGGMSSSNRDFDAEVSGVANLLSGGPMTGATSVEIVGTGGLSLQVGLSGSGSVEISGASGLSLTIGLAGSGTVEITGSAGLAMRVPLDGLASMSVTGSADLKGFLSLAGDVTPFTTLSPENLAKAVWSALAADNNDPGTMGNKLNGAASAGDPWGTELPGTYPVGTAGHILGNIVSGLTPTQAAQLLDIFRRLGLDPLAPLVTNENDGLITAGALSQTVVEAPEGVVTVTRSP